MIMLTLQNLKDMKPWIFASWKGKVEHPRFNDAKNVDDNNETVVNRVAVRWHYHDWKIYHSLDSNFEQADYLDGVSHLEVSNERIAASWAKLYNGKKARELVECDDEAFDMYW